MKSVLRWPFEKGKFALVHGFFMLFGIKILETYFSAVTVSLYSGCLTGILINALNRGQVAVYACGVNWCSLLSK